MRLPIPQPGKYVVLVEYANTDGQQTAGVAVTSPQQAPQQGTSTFYTCDYRYEQRAEGRGLGRSYSIIPLLHLEGRQVYCTYNISASLVCLQAFVVGCEQSPL